MLGTTKFTLLVVLLALGACQMAPASDRSGPATLQQQQRQEYAAFLRSMLRDAQYDIDECSHSSYQCPAAARLDGVGAALLQRPAPADAARLGGYAVSLGDALRAVSAASNLQMQRPGAPSGITP